MMQAGKDYGVRVIRAYENKVVGRIIFPAALERSVLLQRGLVERVPAPPEDGDAEQGLLAGMRRGKSRRA